MEYNIMESTKKSRETIQFWWLYYVVSKDK